MAMPPQFLKGADKNAARKDVKQDAEMMRKDEVQDGGFMRKGKNRKVEGRPMPGRRK